MLALRPIALGLFVLAHGCARSAPEHLPAGSEGPAPPPALSASMPEPIAPAPLAEVAGASSADSAPAAPKADRAQGRPRPGPVARPNKPTPRTVYVCPMHPEVVQDQPGDCPKCNMHLEPKPAAAITTAAPRARVALADEVAP